MPQVPAMDDQFGTHSAPVSTGFVARALERFAQRLAAAGFDDAMTTALRAEDVLCADETPPM
jgi:hypothetical protein